MRYEIRELNVGGILDQTINLIKNNLGLFLKITAFLYMPCFLLQLIMQHVHTRGIAPGEVQTPNLAYLGVWFLIMVVAMPLTNAAIINAVARKYLDQPTDATSSFKKGLTKVLPLIWTNLLSSIFVGFGLVLLIIPGIYLAIGYSLSSGVVVLDDLNGMAALKRSRELVKGQYGLVFVLFLLIFIVNFAVNAIAGIVPTVLLSALVSVALSAITVILATSAMVVLYFSSRCKQENFDLTVLAQAMSDEVMQEQAEVQAEVQAQSNEL